MVREEGHADAGGTAILDAFQVIGLVDRRANFFADGLCLQAGFFGAFAQIVQQYHELVATQSGHRIAFTHAQGKPCRGLLQQTVALVMAKGVIDFFEIIEVDEHQRPIVAGSNTACDRMSQAIHQHAPVGKAGQNVKECQMLDLLLRRLVLGDIGLGTHIMGNGTDLIPDGGNGHPGRIDLAVPATIP